MKKSTLYIGFLALIAMLTVSSCKNDLDVLAPGEESVSVYGILNPNDATQNIRINKVYITDGDVIAAGEDATKINYGPGELKVTLQRFMSGSSTPTLTTVGNASKKEIVLTETVVATASGNFNSSQRVWQTNDKLYNTGEYKLTITNLLTGKEFTSQNLVVDSVKANYAMPLKYLEHPNVNFAYPNHGGYIPNGGAGTTTPQDRYIDYSNLSVVDQHIKFKSIPNARLYNVNMRFYYIDYLTSGDSAYNFVDMNFPTVKSKDLLGGEIIDVSFTTLSFYTTISSAINSKNVQNLNYRKVNYMEYTVIAGAESLDDFMKINAPSNSIAQDKANYTNINGGVGIFSSKSKTIISKDLWYDFIDKIACHPITNSLRFKNSLGNLPTPCN